MAAANRRLRQILVGVVVAAGFFALTNTPLVDGPDDVPSAPTASPAARPSTAPESSPDAAGSSAANDVADPPVPEGALEGVVTEISDGDTLWLRVTEPGATGLRPQTEYKFRLLQIDAPERGIEGGSPECFAEAAATRLTELAPIGSVVRAAYDTDRQDRFVRELVHVWTDEGRWVNGALVAGGYAEALAIAPNTAHEEAVRAREQTAREAGLGLWSACR